MFLKKYDFNIIIRNNELKIIVVLNRSLFKHIKTKPCSCIPTVHSISKLAVSFYFPSKYFEFEKLCLRTINKINFMNLFSQNGSNEIGKL